MKLVQISVLAFASLATALPSFGLGSRGLTVCTPQGNGGGDTENGIKNGNCCTDVTIVFARGTTEAGNVGGVAGPPLFKALRNKIGAGRVTVQGTAYPADFAGFFQGGVTGAPQMASDIKAVLARCPKTNIVVSGYSQGAQVAHNAFNNGISASQVKVAVLFGDPYKNRSVGNLPASLVKEYCAKGDSICEVQGSFMVTAAHSTYGMNADDAASFIVSKLGL